jgi:hypothetical protein
VTGHLTKGSAPSITGGGFRATARADPYSLDAYIVDAERASGLGGLLRNPIRAVLQPVVDDDYVSFIPEVR